MLNDKSEDNALHLKAKVAEQEENIPPEQPEDANSDEEEPGVAAYCLFCLN